MAYRLTSLPNKLITIENSPMANALMTQTLPVGKVRSSKSISFRL